MIYAVVLGAAKGGGGAAKGAAKSLTYGKSAAGAAIYRKNLINTKIGQTKGAYIKEVFFMPHLPLFATCYKVFRLIYAKYSRCGYKVYAAPRPHLAAPRHSKRIERIVSC